MTDFLRRSVHRREELFREHVQSEPRVEVPLVELELAGPQGGESR
jgi:hypothetical protein